MLESFGVLENACGLSITNQFFQPLELVIFHTLLLLVYYIISIQGDII